MAEPVTKGNLMVTTAVKLPVATCVQCPLGHGETLTVEPQDELYKLTLMSSHGDKLGSLMLTKVGLMTFLADCAVFVADLLPTDEEDI